MQLRHAFLIAFSTYSRIPVPQADWSEENRRYALCFFPLIGLVIGPALWAWLAACDALGAGAMLRGVVGAAIPIVLTGGIHMDGFMDTCDALGSHQSRERKLEILKDSRVGAFAVMGCALYLMACAALMGELRAQDGVMAAAAFVCSRAMSAAASVTMKGVRPGGMLAGFAGTARRRVVLISSAVYMIVSAAVWIVCGGWKALLLIAAAVGCAAWYRRMAYREFGGATGDLAGWFLQVTELALLAVIAMGGMM